MSLKIRDVMVKNVITVEANFTVKHAGKIMSLYGIGCLVVLENERVVGIVTERDMLKRIVAVGRDPEKTFVKEIMSKPVIAVGPDVDLENAVKLMFKHKIKKLPVIEGYSNNKRLKGLVTLTDLVRLQPKLIEILKELFTHAREVPPKSMEKVLNYYIV